MMKTSEIYSFLNSAMPFDTQAPWDNSGLIAGDMNADVNSVMLALDLTADVVEQACEKGCGLIITHHPAIFTPIKSVTSPDPLYFAVNNGISVISVHTCYDIAYGGVNDILCDIIGIDVDEKICDSEDGMPFIAVGHTDITDVEALARSVGEKLGGNVRFASCGKTGKVAVCSGSGCSLLPDLVRLGVNTFITGDAGHHNFIDFGSSGISLIAAGHFETEVPAMRVLADRIRNTFDGISVFTADENNPVSTVICNGT